MSKLFNTSTIHRRPLLGLFLFSAIVVFGSVFGVQASDNEGLPALTFPSDPITFQSGPGSQVATTYCLICHSAEYIYMQPPHSRERWEEIVKKMKHTFGCPIPEADIQILATYLYGQNEIQPSAQLPKMTKRMDDLPVQSAAPSSGNSEKGKRVFGIHCVNCHGQSGKGDGPIGKALVPPAANLTALGKKSDKDILRSIIKGRPGTAMPSWKHDLSSQEIHDVLAYIRTLAQ